MHGPELLRGLHRSRVLVAIRQARRTSRAALAEATGLSRPTISAVVEELLAGGWVREVGIGESSGGRPPMVLEFLPAARLTLGMELSAGHVRGVLCDLEGGIHARFKERVQSMAAAAALEPIRRGIAALLAQRPPGAQVVAIGAGLTGLVHTGEGLWQYSPHFPGGPVPVQAMLSEWFDLPVTLENDARCLALGEFHYGAGHRVRHLIAVRIGVGIGAGILLDGRPYIGADGGAGELGHTHVADAGPRCQCGRYGCLEAVAAAGAIAHAAKVAVRRGRASRLAERGDPDALLATDVIAAARAGDELAREVLAGAGRLIGVAVGNLLNVLNPDLVIIGGGTSQAGDDLLEPLRESALARALPVIRDRVQIRLASFGEFGVAVGAAAMVAAPLLQPVVFQVTAPLPRK